MSHETWTKGSWMRPHRMAVYVAAPAAMLLAGCSTLDTLTNRADEIEGIVDEIDAELNDEINQAIDEASGNSNGGEDSDGDESDTDSGPGTDGAATSAADAEALATRDLDAEVYYQGLGFSFEQMIATENEQGGIELVIEVTAHNDWDSAAALNPPLSLLWEEPGSSNTVTVNGIGEIRQIPAGASASGQYTLTISQQDLEVFDSDSARLVLGRDGSATAQIPLGSEPELITRIPTAQQVPSEPLQAGEAEITIEYVEVSWNHGDPGQQQLPAGQVGVIMDYTIHNHSGSQLCTPRGQGNTWSLISAEGAGYADLGTSERCVSGGSTLAAVTGFTIDEPFEGQYTLTLTFDQRGDDYEASTELTLDLDAPAAEPESD
ncbi:hypothetical protein [Bogoriella caseilytica]|nr:hypothetical protein [Bogoriella caseilytica]